MVTLLGFMFILANVALLEVYIPDLASPVRLPCSFPMPAELSLILQRLRLGSILALPLACGCMLDILKVMGSRLMERLQVLHDGQP